MYRILLVDDEKLLLDSLEIILSLSNMEIVGKAADGRAALGILEQTDKSCDLALVDLNMKGMGGIELIKVLKEKYPEIKILVLTTFYDDRSITSAIAGGADGYLLKDSGRDVILGAITQIIGGTTVLDQKVMLRLSSLIGSNSQDSRSNAAGSLLNDREQYGKSGGGGSMDSGIFSDGRAESAVQRRGEYLTEREKQICQLMVEGLTNRQIAEHLYISEGTVKNYISNIYDKTGIHDRVKLIVELKK